MIPISGPAFAKVAEGKGWRLLRVNGSHHVYGKAGEAARLVIPMHGQRELKIGLQRSLMKTAGLGEADLG